MPPFERCGECVARPTRIAPTDTSAAMPNSHSTAHRTIPEIWSGKLLEKFYAACTLASISNTDYEGEIKNMALLNSGATDPLSGELRERQFDTLAAKVPHLASRVHWLDGLPPREG